VQRSGPFPPQPARPNAESSDRRWVGATVVVLVLVAIAFVVLLAYAFGG
jgi:hypothetical protein